MTQRKLVTVIVSYETKRQLEKRRLTPTETYDSVLNRIMDKQDKVNQAEGK